MIKLLTKVVISVYTASNLNAPLCKNPYYCLYFIKLTWKEVLKKEFANTEQKTRSGRKERKYFGTKVNGWVLTGKVL